MMTPMMKVEERFLTYVAYDTTSDGSCDQVPSTVKQKILGDRLVRDMKEMGLQDAHMDEWGYVYGFLPGSEDRKEDPALGLIAHMDTSPAACGANVKPSVVLYEGGDIPLGKSGICLSPKVFPFLEDYIGQRLIVTDGTTLLGADDKAGIAEILTVCQYFLSHPQESHRAIAICFTPDEEIGRGPDHFDLKKFRAPAAYTVDGGKIGELDQENFNAAVATVTIQGVNIHSGYAKNKMKNAILIAHQLISMLPAAEAPAHTEGYEGFYHVSKIEGQEAAAVIEIGIRDFEESGFAGRKAFLEGIGAYLNRTWGEGTISIAIRDLYYNMKEKLLPHRELIDNAIAAMEKNGVTPKLLPSRGGTDGAKLSYMGLPCPNLSTGCSNAHGVLEFVSIESMETMVAVLSDLARM